MTAVADLERALTAGLGPHGFRRSRRSWRGVDEEVAQVLALDAAQGGAQLLLDNVDEPRSSRHAPMRHPARGARPHACVGPVTTGAAGERVPADGPYRVHFVLCPASGASCASGCVRSFRRLEDAERCAAEVLGRTPALADPRADRLAEVRRLRHGEELVVRRISWRGRGASGRQRVS